MFFKKRCPNCGSSNPKNATICSNCNSSFEVKQVTKQLETPEPIKVCDEAVSLHPQSAEVYYQRGFVYQKLGDSEHAIEDFNKAIQINPQFAMAYSNRGFAYLNNKRYDLAITDCTKAIAIDSKDAVALLNRAFAYKLRGEKTKATADFNKVINLTDKPQLIKTAKKQITELSK